jgi:hypothetical protein
VVQITGCGALDRYQPVNIDVADLDLAAQYVLSTLYGWNLRTDPMAQTWEVSPVQQASALGYLLSHDLIEVATAEQRASLLGQFEAIAADQAAQAAFAANLSAEGAATLANALAEQRALAVSNGGGPDRGVAVDPALQDEVVAIDRIVAILADTIIGPGASVEAARSVLAGMRPYTAALVISQLDAPDEAITTLTLDTLDRYRSSFDDETTAPFAWELPDSTTLGIADLLFPRIAAMDPAQANGFVVDLLDLDPSLLLSTVHDPSNAVHLVAAATDRAAIEVSDAGAVLVPLFRYLMDPGDSSPVPSTSYNEGTAWSGVRAGLLPVIAPWVSQFLDRTDDWGWSDTEADSAVRFAMSTEGAADLDALIDACLDTIPDGSQITLEELQQRLHALGTLLGELLPLVEDRVISQAESDRFLWDLTLRLLPKLASKAVGATGLEGLPANVAIRLASWGLVTGAQSIEGRGLPGVPDPAAEVQAGVTMSSNQARAQAAYLAVGSVIQLKVASGDLPTGTPWPPPPPDEVDECGLADYEQQVHDWITGDSSVIPDHAQSDLTSALGDFVGAADAAADCQRAQG